jgi:hypothetical protein
MMILHAIDRILVWLRARIALRLWDNNQQLLAR